MYSLILEPEFNDDIDKHLRSGNKKLVQKILSLLDEITDDPRSGTGKPEQLKGFRDKEIWSRRIDKKHRIVYEIKDKELVIIAISAFGHYGDK